MLDYAYFLWKLQTDDIIKGYFSQEYEEDGKFLNDDFNQFIRTDHKQCGLSKKFATAIFLAEKEPTFEKRFLIFIYYNNYYSTISYWNI